MSGSFVSAGENESEFSEMFNWILTKQITHKPMILDDLGSSSFDIIYCYKNYLALTLGSGKKSYTLSSRLKSHIRKIIESLEFKYTWTAVTNKTVASF